MRIEILGGNRRCGLIDDFGQRFLDAHRPQQSEHHRTFLSAAGPHGEHPHRLDVPIPQGQSRPQLFDLSLRHALAENLPVRVDLNGKKLQFSLSHLPPQFRDLGLLFQFRPQGEWRKQRGQIDSKSPEQRGQES